MNSTTWSINYFWKNCIILILLINTTKCLFYWEPNVLIVLYLSSNYKYISRWSKRNVQMVEHFIFHSYSKWKRFCYLFLVCSPQNTTSSASKVYSIVWITLSTSLHNCNLCLKVWYLEINTDKLGCHIHTPRKELIN